MYGKLNTNSAGVLTLVVVLVLGMSVSPFMGLAAAQTTADYEVATGQEYADAVANASDGQVVRLTSNIDMDNVSYTATNTSVVIDGNGYTISNLNTSLYDTPANVTVYSVDMANPSVSGGVIANDASNAVDIDNVTISNATVTSSGNGGGLFAQISVGANTAQINNVTFNGDIDAGTAGGLVGDPVQSNMAVYDVEVDATINATSSGAGGLTGAILEPATFGNGNATIERMYVSGTITSEANQAKGLTGKITGTVTNVGVTADVISQGTDADAAGLVKNVDNLENVFFAGNIASTGTGTSYPVAKVVNNVSKNAFWDEQVTGITDDGTYLGTGQQTADMTVSKLGFPTTVWLQGDTYPVLSSSQFDGQVLDESQTGLANATVTLYDSSGASLTNITTDSNGYWSADGSLDAAYAEISADGYYTATIDPVSTSVSYTTTLTSGSDGAGLSVIAQFNDSGNSLTNGSVQLTGPVSKTVDLDANGVASISSLEAGDYTVTLTSPEIQEDVTANVTLSAGESESLVLQGKAYNTITGTITDSGGTPIVGVQADLERASMGDDGNVTYSVIDTAYSDANGTVVYENVPDGDSAVDNDSQYQIVWSVYDTEYSEPFNLTDPSSNSLTVSSSNDFKTGTLEVDIENDEAVFGGNAIDGTVTLMAKDDTRLGQVSVNSTEFAYFDVATDTGYWVVVESDGYKTKYTKLDDNQTYQVYENETTKDTVNLGAPYEPAPSLNVSTTLDGEPVNATVNVEKQYIGGSVFTQTAADGSVLYADAVSGQYYIVSANYTANNTTYTASENLRIEQAGETQVDLVLVNPSQSGGGAFFGDSGLPVIIIVAVGGGVAYLLIQSGGNGGSGRSRRRSGQYARK